jgi:hypothetical protein
MSVPPNMDLFRPGDVIRNKRPYNGEHAYWVAGTNEYGYLCHPLIGIHSPKPNFMTKCQIDFYGVGNYEKLPEGHG